MEKEGEDLWCEFGEAFDGRMKLRRLVFMSGGVFAVSRDADNSQHKVCYEHIFLLTHLREVRRSVTGAW